MLVTLFVFQFEISGKDIKDEQYENILLIFLTLHVFHLEISGRYDKFEQFKNIN